jgi:type IX secretion system substrate protein
LWGAGVIYQQAKSGVGFTGLWALNGIGDSGREYIQGKLSIPLEADSCYYIEFYSNLSNGCAYAIDELGIYISSTAVSAPINTIMPYTPQIVSSYFITDTLGWTKISGYYQAVGGEQYLTIGDFKTFVAGDTLLFEQGAYFGAYYFIDDVSIQKVSGCDTTLSIYENVNSSLFRLYPNPNNGNMTLGCNLNEKETGTLLIYDLSGRLVDKKSISSGTKVLAIDVKVLESGTYLYEIIVNNKQTKIDKFIVIK